MFPYFTVPRAARTQALMTARSTHFGIVGVFAALFAMAALPVVASAQFASGLTAPPPAVPAAVAAAAESTVVAKRDSVALEQRLDMKAWVDSAVTSMERGGAPVAPIPVSPGDSVSPLPPMPPIPVSPKPRPTPPPDSARPPSVLPPAKRPSANVSIRPSAPGITEPGTGTGTIRPSVSGITPPDTATSTSLLALVGAGLVGSGFGLLRRKG